MDPEQANKWIDQLEAFQKRPALYLGDTNVMFAIVFLSGFMYAIAHDFLKTKSVDYQMIHEKVIQSRGWRVPGATGPWVHVQMAEKGMTPLEIIRELAAIDIDIIREAISK